MAFLYDSDNPDSIPDGVWAAGYCDGYAANAWNARGWNRFPNAKRIAVFAYTNAGGVADVERGDMFPWEAPDWCLRARARGEDPWVYVNMSNWGPTRTEFQLRGIPEPHWWLALYDNDPTIPPGAIAKQFANSTLTGHHYDLSVVRDAVKPEIEGVGMFFPRDVRPDGTGTGEIWAVFWQGVQLVGVRLTPVQWSALIAGGAVSHDASVADMANVRSLPAPSIGSGTADSLTITLGTAKV